MALDAMVDAVNDSFFDDNLLVDFYPDNESLVNNTNGTGFLLFRPVYPSGYSLPHIIIASIVVTIVMIVVIVGNMLVIIAICTEKSLKNIQNWFIASLAVADFFLGLVIMPFSLANELMGYWIFGNMWCDVHSAMDVLLSTASIMNLCLISLDRYWSITQAIDYLRKRTPSRAILMITFVWIASGLICIPPLLGWKVKREEDSEFPECKLSEDIGYVLYSALGSFYVPSCIMVFVYIRIYFAAKARARRGIRQKKKQQEQCTSFTTPSPALRMPGSHSPVDKNSNSPMKNIVTIETISPPVPVIPTVTCDFASDMSTSDNGELHAEAAAYLESKDTLKMPSMPAVCPTKFRASTLSVNGDLQQQAAQRCRAPSVAIDTDMVSEFDPSSSDSGVVSRCAVVKPLKLRFCKPIFGRKASKAKREVIDLGKMQQQQQQQHMVQIEEVPQVVKPKDPEREKRRLARKKEKRATLILGLIMGSFIACWLPFFFLYILVAVCKPCVVPRRAFSFAFWLGYMNSALNPVIYTIFNKDFRRAFRRILFK